MRPTTRWEMWLGLMSLWGLVTLPHSLQAEETAPACLAVEARCPTGATQATADDLWTREWLTLHPAVSVPLEDPINSACGYVGFQAEWVASKRDAGLPLVEVLAAFRRVIAPDLPWQGAITGAMGTLVYHTPQCSPAELRQVLEAACLVHPRPWAGRRTERVGVGAIGRVGATGVPREDYDTENMDHKPA